MNKMTFSFDNPEITERGKKITQKKNLVTWKFQKRGAKRNGLSKLTLAAGGRHISLCPESTTLLASRRTFSWSQFVCGPRLHLFKSRNRFTTFTRLLRTFKCNGRYIVYIKPRIINVTFRSFVLG